MKSVQYRQFTNIGHHHTKFSRQVICEPVILCNMPQDLNLQNNTDCKQNNSRITLSRMVFLTNTILDINLLSLTKQQLVLTHKYTI
jgi:hypothetical protein